jgi:hypothetical protein
METSVPAVDGTLLARFGERSPIPPAFDYSADMLQCTTQSIWPQRLDYLVVERIARDMRNQYIASLLGRAKRALANRFAEISLRSLSDLPGDTDA